MKRKMMFGVAAACVAASIFVFQPFSDRGGATSGASDGGSSASASARPGLEFTRLSLEDWRERVAEASLEDFREVMAVAMRIGDRELRHQVVAMLVHRWLAEDTADFLKYHASLEVMGLRLELAVMMDVLQQVLTELDPELAQSDEILTVAERLISQLAQVDPEKALTWARQWLTGDLMENALVAVVRNLARQDLGRALEVVETMGSPLRKMQAQASLGAVWAASDAAAAMAWARSLGSPTERAMVMNSVLLVSARLDAGGSASELAALASQIQGEWLEERRRALALHGMTELDTVNDPETYLEMMRAGEVPPPESPEVELMAEAGKVIGGALATQDPSSAATWAEGLDGEYLKFQSLAGVVESWAATDPEGALRFVLAEHGGHPQLLDSAFSSWAALDPLAAAEAVGRVGNPHDRDAVLQTVVRRWALNGDPLEAAGYVASLPPSLATDQMLLSIATQLGPRSPEQAWAVASGIGDESIQYRALRPAFVTMLAADADAANRLLAGAELPGGTAERLNEMSRALVER